MRISWYACYSRHREVEWFNWESCFFHKRYQKPAQTTIHVYRYVVPFAQLQRNYITFWIGKRSPQNTYQPFTYLWYLLAWNAQLGEEFGMELLSLQFYRIVSKCTKRTEIFRTFPNSTILSIMPCGNCGAEPTNWNSKNIYICKSESLILI